MKSKHTNHKKSLVQSGETKDGRFMTVIHCHDCNEKECIYSDESVEPIKEKDLKLKFK